MASATACRSRPPAPSSTRRRQRASHPSRTASRALVGAVDGRRVGEERPGGAVVAPEHLGEGPEGRGVVDPSLVQQGEEVPEQLAVGRVEVAARVEAELRRHARAQCRS